MLRFDWQRMMDASVAERLQHDANAFFDRPDTRQQMPSYIGRILVDQLHLGTTPPEVELVSLSDSIYKPLSDERYPASHQSLGKVNPHHHQQQQQRADEFMDEHDVTTSPWLDLHSVFRVRYDGDFSLRVMTELKLDVPTDRFMVLPMAIRVCHVKLEGNVSVDVLDHKARISVLSSSSSSPPSSSSTATTTTTTTTTTTVALGGELSSEEQDSNPVRGPLIEIKVQSEMGDPHKQVLKNVAKVERFIVEQMKRFIQEKLGYPNHREIHFSPRPSHEDDPYID